MENLENKREVGKCAVKSVKLILPKLPSTIKKAPVGTDRTWSGGQCIVTHAYN